MLVWCSMCVLHGGTLWNVSCGLPRGVKLLCLFNSFGLIYFMLWMWILLYGVHQIKSLYLFLFFLYISFWVIPPCCAYTYSILWSLTSSPTVLSFSLIRYVRSIGVSLINLFIFSQFKIHLGKTAYYCMHFKDKFRLWSEAWICQRF